MRKRLPYSLETWGIPYMIDGAMRLLRRSPSGPVHVWLAITDHYEPFWAKCDAETARARVSVWRRRWPEIAKRFSDSSGKPAQYSFFYPEEEYRPELLDPLAEMTHEGLGDVEIHLHHDGEGQQNFIDRMSGFKETLVRRHGLLRRNGDGVVFGFIHGNWALDNSRPDGRWCGLNNELQLLRGLGCYADFTMPCGPSPMQPRMVNRIYWATDDPGPKSYDRGLPAENVRWESGDLLMITGPFGLRWKERLKPRLEIGELAHYDPPNEYRVKRWLDLAPRIGAHIFVKLFSHGTQEKNSAMLLEGGLEFLFDAVQRECKRRGYQIHFATAWQMYQAVQAAVAANNGARR